MKQLFVEDISLFKYFMSEKEIKDFMKTKIILGLTPLMLLIPMLIYDNFSFALIIPIAMAFAYKIPYLLLKMRHNQHCNDTIIAVPLWLSSIYALIEKNTIHNAIVNSLDDNTPAVIRKDLMEFIALIEQNSEDKNAYLGFLKKYKIDGFDEIMLKLYEFRSLDKKRLKDEFDYLNNSLEKINKMKREQRFRSEVSILDYIVAAVLIGIPCIYLLAVSMMPELYSNFM